MRPYPSMLLCAVLLTLGGVSGQAATIYLASAQCSGTYNPTTNTCTGGSFNSWDTLGEIETNAAINDTINICPGTWNAPSGDFVDLKDGQTWQAATCGGSSARPVLNCATATGVSPIRGCLHGNSDDNVRIEGLQFNSCQQSCIRDILSSGLEIVNNVFNNWNTTATFTQGMQSGIFLLDSEQALIEQNQFYGSGSISPQDAIKVGNGNNNNGCGHTIRSNYIDGNWTGTGSHVGIAADVRCGATSQAGGRNLIEKNFIQEMSSCILIEVGSSTVARYNLCKDVEHGVRTRSHTTTDDDSEVYQNTFYTSGANGGDCLSMYRVVDSYPSQTPGNFTNWLYRDNICSGPFQNFVVVWSVGVPEQVSNDVNYNNYWNTDASNALACIDQPLGANTTRDVCQTGGGATLYTESQLATYRTATGFDANSLNVDPQFVNTATNDFNVGNAALIGASSTGQTIGAFQTLPLTSCITTDTDTITCAVTNPFGVLSSATLAAIDVTQATNCTDTTPQSVTTSGNNLLIQLAGTACDPLVGGQAIDIDMAYSALEDSLCIGDGTVFCLNGQSRAVSNFAVTNTIGGSSPAYASAGFLIFPANCTEPCQYAMREENYTGVRVAPGGSIRLRLGVDVSTANAPDQAYSAACQVNAGGYAAITGAVSTTRPYLAAELPTTLVTNGLACTQKLADDGGTFAACVHRTGTGDFPTQQVNSGQRLELELLLQIPSQLVLGDVIQCQPLAGSTQVTSGVTAEFLVGTPQTLWK